MKALLLVSVFSLSVVGAWAQEVSATPTPDPSDPHPFVELVKPSGSLPLGNPTGATDSDPNNLLLPREGFVLGYNSSALAPLWGSWVVEKGKFTWPRLTKEQKAGQPTKHFRFAVDASLPASIPQASPKVFTKTGFDRSHLVPPEDFDLGGDTRAPFYIMPNCVAQSPTVSRFAVSGLEAYVRDVVSETGGKAYVLSGVIPKGGEGREGYREYLGEGAGKVMVPWGFWKVVVFSDPGGNVSKDSRVVATIFPNNGAPNYAWWDYRVSPAAVEKAAGVKLFDTLPPEMASVLRGRVDKLPIPEPDWVKDWRTREAAKAAGQSEESKPAPDAP